MRSILTLSLLLTISTFAGADEGRIEIGPTDTFPIVIDEPGSYVLTSNLHSTVNGVNAIEITADNVTLDLGGHTIHGPGMNFNGTGITSDDQTGIAIFNGTVTEFAGGIRITSGSTPTGINRFHDLVITNIWTNGLSFTGGVGHDIVAENISVPAYLGAGVSCSHCSLSNVTVRSSYEGISLYKGSAVNCTAIGNLTGIELRWSSLTGGTVVDNTGTGVNALVESTVIGVAASGNGYYGINLETDGNNNAVNCTAASNGSGAIVGCGDGNGCHQNYVN